MSEAPKEEIVLNTAFDDDPALEKARKELEEQKEKLAPPPPTEDAPVPDEPENITPPEPVVDWEQKFNALQNKVRSDAGKRGAELDKLRKQNSILTARVTDLEQMSQSGTIEDAIEKLSTSMSDDDREIFKEFIEEAVGNTKTERRDEPNPISEELQKTRQRMDELEQKTASEKFMAEVERQAPGFNAANGNDELGLAPDASWLAFLDEPRNPNSPDQETWKEYAQRVYTPAAFAFVFHSWQKPHPSPDRSTSRQAASQHADDLATPSLDDLAVPPSQVTGYAGRGPQDGQQPVFRRADYDALRRQAAIPGSDPALRQRLKTFQRAEIEGRLV